MELAARVAAMRPSRVRDLAAAAGERDLLTLGGGLPPSEAFPYDELAAAADRVLRRGDSSALQYSATEGDAALLELLRADVKGRDIPGAVFVTSGSQQALDLLGKILLDPGDVVVVECPTYVGALRAFASYQPEFVSVAVDRDGLNTDELGRLLEGGLRPKLCYVVANFSNPSGATLSIERRQELARLSHVYDFVIIEDDPYRQLRFRGPELASVASHAGNVVHLGSFSKVVAPGLRVGYAVVPTLLASAFALAKQAADLTSSSFNQKLLVELLTAPGWFDTHVARLRALYGERADALLHALDGRFDVLEPDGGMFLWARAPVDADALAASCMARDVAIVPGSEFALRSGYERDVRLSFSLLAPDDLREAARRISQALDELMSP